MADIRKAKGGIELRSEDDDGDTREGHLAGMGS
jgi:hypothetical protein